MQRHLVDLLHVAEFIQQQDFAAAQRLLDDIASEVCDQTTASDRLTLRFIDALRVRAAGESCGSGNLYHGTQAVSEHDMISAFRVLAEATPLIRFGY